jgi:TATA-binding protein-associated factor Taf7
VAQIGLFQKRNRKIREKKNNKKLKEKKLKRVKKKLSKKKSNLKKPLNPLLRKKNIKLIKVSIHFIIIIT